MPIRCLIVDDNATFLASASRALEQQGLTVVAVASSAYEAAQLTAERRPDVALIDVHLGDESGFDVARRIAAAPSPPIIVFISTYEELDLQDLIAASPAAGFLPKAALTGAAVAAFLT